MGFQRIPRNITVRGGTVDVVTTQVPFAFRDNAFWPCITGETFPPVFNTSAAGYSTTSGVPVVGVSTVNLGGGTAYVSWPVMPRASFTGKRALKLTAAVNFTGNGAGVNVARFGLINNSVGTFAGRRIALVFTPSGANVTVKVETAAGTSGVLATVANDANFHNIEVDLTSAGDVTVIWDGAVIHTESNVWPYNATDAMILAVARDVGSNGQGVVVAAPQIAWS